MPGRRTNNRQTQPQASSFPAAFCVIDHASTRPWGLSFWYKSAAADEAAAAKSIGAKSKGHGNALWSVCTEGEHSQKHRCFIQDGKNGAFRNLSPISNTIFNHIISLEKKSAMQEKAYDIAETDINFSEMFIEDESKARYDKMDNGMGAFSIPALLRRGRGIIPNSSPSQKGKVKYEYSSVCGRAPEDLRCAMAYP